KEYARAIEILQALLNRREQCFVPTSDPRRYVSLAVRATEVIGAMPEAGMKLYRSLYDPQAERLLAAAGQEYDLALLREIIARYFHSRFGHQALNLLGTIQFDRGEFAQAAHSWRAIGRGYRSSQIDEGVLLAKVAVAHHFAGEPRRAREALSRLKSRYGQAEAVLEGTKQNAAAFVERVLANPPPTFAGVRAVSRGWRSLAGAPDSVAVMSPCRPVLSPRWTRPRGKLDGNINLAALVSQLRQMPPGMIYQPGRGNRNQQRLLQREGRIILTTGTGASIKKAVLPAMLHPVVADATVFVREADAVVAYDLLTGERFCDSSTHLPLYRPGQNPSVRRFGYNYGLRYGAPEDQGICTLTVGGDKVFAVGMFATAMYRRYVSRRQTPVADTSVLAAFSLSGQLKLAWRTDRKSGPEFLQGCKFLSAPTYAAGRLYVVAKHTQSYYLVCLDAETGQMVWPEPPMISQAPVIPSRYMRYPMAWHDRGSAPAVADGRVFACTNAGVVAAFEADSGRGVWAYQYDSARNRPVSSQRIYRPPVPGVSYPPNPIIVAKGRVICLPADGKRLLALRADTGELAWTPTDRAGQRHLTAISDTQVLLSGPRLMILSAVTGKSEWTSQSVADIHGRPAVTPEAIMASGKGRVVLVSLPAHHISAPPLVSSDAALGNLVCADGKLVGANAAGVSAYFTFSDAHAELTARLTEALAKDPKAAIAYSRYKQRQEEPDLDPERVTEASKLYGYAIQLATYDKMLEGSALSDKQKSELKAENFTGQGPDGIIAWGSAIYAALIDHEAQVKADVLLEERWEPFKQEHLAEIDGDRPPMGRTRQADNLPDLIGTDTGALYEDAFSPDRKPKK
ncbi:hypothetical protein LCGC14_1845710, partial [marine sediment metagenome]